MKVVDEYLDEEHERLIKYQKEYLDALMDFITLIGELGDEKKENIIYKKYIEQLDMKDIASEEDISYHYTYQLEKIALKELEIVLTSRNP